MKAGDRFSKISLRCFAAFSVMMRPHFHRHLVFSRLLAFPLFSFLSFSLFLLSLSLGAPVPWLGEPHTSKHSTRTLACLRLPLIEKPKQILWT